MRGVWNRIQGAALIALVAVWLLVCSHAVVCHCDHEAESQPSSPTVCLCVCHAALETAPLSVLCAPSEDAIRVPDYVPPHGTSLPLDIFRPPLTNG